ncbi:rab proteins geranylgeranyltransferase component A 1 [Periophthalmus magnuspinnatus]|uniref:rab proteins geranylgeranyltransferase component A 1 n=1 Tax=Periophthalmus magnuspinnatus TaxID=409849 RepID=UPI00145BCEAC|nr:rab proteins geranylgeranyltransferase component A 1 [Periophthalmus magnuspinnatus]
MAAEELPSEVDVVIVGTGLCEAVVAAACSRVGQRVLHLDRRSYYAGDWASFTFPGLLSWIQEQQAEPEPEQPADWSSLLQEGEELVHLNQSYSSISNLQVHCYVSEEEEPPSTEKTEEETGASGSEGTQDQVPESQSEPCTETEGQSEPCDETEGQSEPCDETEGQSEPCGETEGQSESCTETEGQSEPCGETNTQSETGNETEGQSEQRRLTLPDLVREGRRFNIDLVSKLLFSRGSLVNLLIQSNVSRYAEFKNVSRILTILNGNVTQVPCSRADVFSSRQLSVVDKRKLMKFLTSCLDENDPPTEFVGRSYMDFLEQQSLGAELRHFLFYSIAGATEDTPTEAGLASTRHFLRCLGRYGNTPFLFPVYGLGEIPQCFCRMCAVFGGIYCLRHSVQSLVLHRDSNRCVAVIDSRGQRISCCHCVLESGLWDPPQTETRTRTRSSLTSRAVLITDRSILPSDSELNQVSLVSVPSLGSGFPSVRIVELSPSTMTCINGTYLVHLTCASTGSAHHDLFPVVTSLFRTPESPDHSGPSVLWSLYFNMAASSEVEGQELPINVHMGSAPDSALGHDVTIAQAEKIFQKIVPDEEFCPPAPNPEDIIYDLESGGPEGGGPEGGGPEGGGPEGGGPEGGGPEGAGPESGGPESGGPESGGPESGGPESGGPESGGPESGGPEGAGPEGAGPDNNP